MNGDDEMKKIKLLIMGTLALILLTGCFKRDTMDNITIYTTTYPIQYLVESMYGYNSEVDTIYPNGININEYELTKKQLTAYSKADLFVYNGLDREKNIAASLTNMNNNIKLIDSSKGISINDDENELWYSPSNYLMIAQNIKDSLLNYVSSTIVKQEIETNYNAIKLIISEYDADLKTIADNASNKTLIVGNNIFKFLEKYGFNVIVINEDEVSTSDYNKAKRYIENSTNKYVYVLSTDEDDANVNTFVSLGATKISINSMSNLTDTQVSNNDDYESMMDTFLEEIKKEAYN
jgi:zinc transport system substrate-binding protein